MQTRLAIIGALLALAVGGGAAWWETAERPPSPPPEATEAEPEPEAPLPVPPVPPRIAEGADYEHCLAMLRDDPDGASAFADAWEATGGGEGAAHCHALAEITLGDPAAGATALEKLARESHAPALPRAQVYGQAVQAWLMADDADRAYNAATAAIALSPQDPELLIDRSIAAATTGRYLDAIDDLSAALKLDPKRADALTFRAAAWRHEEKLDRAQDDIERALSIDPENPEAFLERGILRQRRGDRAGAQTDWEKAIALSPDTATADLAQQNLSLLEAGPSGR
jgi:regulator of sirC expression with transglutaminase-like and TPR domain